MDEQPTPRGPLRRLEIERSADARGVELKLTGELDLETTPELDEQLAAIDGGHLGRLLVDLSGVEFMDSTGLAAILRAQRSADSSGHTLSLRRATGQVKRLFDLTGMTQRLTFED
jgi:anti-sigma B factor antagonist